MTHPPTATFTEFAALHGCVKSHVTALRKAGRLVLTDDGKRVRVAMYGALGASAIASAVSDSSARPIAITCAIASAEASSGLAMRISREAASTPGESTQNERLSSSS